MSSSKKPNPASRNFFLENRDRGYYRASRHDRLTEDGKVKVSDMPLAKDLIGIRPLTLEEQVARFSSGILDFRLIADERYTDALLQKVGLTPDRFIDDDDWHDYLDDVPEEGLTPYEIEALNNLRSYAENGGVVHSVVAPPPLPEPSPSAPTTQAQANGDTSPSGDVKS